MLLWFWSSEDLVEGFKKNKRYSFFEGCRLMLTTVEYQKKLTAIWHDKNLGIFGTCFVHALGGKMRQMIWFTGKYRIKSRLGLKHRCRYQPPYDRKLPLTSNFLGFMAALSLTLGTVSTELPVVYYGTTMHKGNSSDNNTAKTITLRHLGDIGEESCILDQPESLLAKIFGIGTDIEAD